jgi:hypothetical protein
VLTVPARIISAAAADPQSGHKLWLATERHLHLTDFFAPAVYEHRHWAHRCHCGRQPRHKRLIVDIIAANFDDPQYLHAGPFPSLCSAIAR